MDLHEIGRPCFQSTMLNFKLNEVRLLIMYLNTNENRIPFILIQYILFVSFSRSVFIYIMYSPCRACLLNSSMYAFMYNPDFA